MKRKGSDSFILYCIVNHHHCVYGSDDLDYPSRAFVDGIITTQTLKVSGDVLIAPDSCWQVETTPEEGS